MSSSDAHFSITPSTSNMCTITIHVIIFHLVFVLRFVSYTVHYVNVHLSNLSHLCYLVLRLLKKKLPSICFTGDLKCPDDISPMFLY